MLNRIVSTLLSKAPEIVVNKVVSEVERALDEPVSIRREDRKRARKLLPLLMRSHESSDWVRLPGPPGRAAFLAAAHQLLVERPEEWAVVGLGTVARRSFVKEVFVRKGRVGSVGLPVSVQAQIRGHIEATPNAEVIHIHNHPDGIERAIKNLVLGEAPVTSDGDREAQQAHEAVAKTAAAISMTRRKVRFFVVENGQLHRYWLPSTGPLRDEADRLFRSLLGSGRG